MIGSELLKGDKGIHRPPIWSKVLRGMERSTDRRIGPRFKRVNRDPRTADLVEIFKEYEGIHGPLIRSEFLKGDEGLIRRSVEGYV